MNFTATSTCTSTSTSTSTTTSTSFREFPCDTHVILALERELGGSEQPDMTSF